MLQLVGRGLDKTTLSKTLPDLSEQAKKRIGELYRAAELDGLQDTFSAVNAEYARCAKRVYDFTGMPPRNSRESHFYFCAGENKVRYEVLMSAILGAGPKDVLPQLAESQQTSAQAVLTFTITRGRSRFSTHLQMS